MSHRWITLLRGLGSLAVTLALVVGVPTALVVFVGSPLPATLPDGDAISAALRTGINDEIVVNVLAIVVWVTWAQLTLALVIETIGIARGKRLPHLPVASSLQGVAARLVAGILLLASPLQHGPVGAQPAPVPIVSAMPSDLTFDLVAASTDDPSTTVEHEAPIPAARNMVTVQRHDSYWALAERHLGDGLRWRELHELNVGRTMSDGHTIRSGDDTLRTGWTIALPVGAEPAEVQSGHEVTSPGEVLVERGDNLWDLSKDRLAADLERAPTNGEIAPYWREVIHANEDRLVQPGNPGLIHPGQVLLLPPTGHPGSQPPASGADPSSNSDGGPTSEANPSETTPAPAPTSTVPSTATTEASVPDEPRPARPHVNDVARVNVGSLDDDDVVEQGSATTPAPWVIAAGGLSSVALAVGLKRLIDRRRRTYLQTHDGHSPPPSSPEQRDLHHAVVAMADEAKLDDLQLALGSLAVGLAASEASCRPRVIRHGPDSLEVLLDHPTIDAPQGWRADGDGSVWTLEEPPNPGEPLDGPMCPSPLLVTIGQPDADAELYLDLEADGVISLTGDIEVARGLARSMLTELALTPLAETLRIIVIGDLVEPDAAHLEHLKLVETWADIADDITSWVHDSRHALIENDWPNSFVGRGHDPDHDALVPIAVIATKPPPPDLLSLLIAERPSAVAIVIADEFDGAITTINCDTDALTLVDVDLSFAPQAVDATELEDMGRLLAFADDSDVGQVVDLREGIELDHALVHSLPPDDADDVGIVAAEPPEHEILVRLLGEIRVDGGAKDLHPKATSVTAYLAIHRAVTSDRLEEACWFGSDGKSHRKRLLEAMTQCRDALGAHHFPANRDGTYRISPAIRTDVELFDWHVAQAADQPPEDAIESYRAALDLVTGRPFAYPNVARASFGWVDLEHHATTWEYRIAGIAKAYAELCFDLDRYAEAIEILRRLAQAVPLNSAVVEALMRAHLEAGDRSAADAVYREHCKALELAKLGDPDEAVEQLRLAFTSGV